MAHVKRATNTVGDRLLLGDDEVGPALAIAVRVFSVGLLSSFSMRGLWGCNASPSDFPKWCASALARGLSAEGVHYTRAPGADGVDDVFVPVAFGWIVATSSTRPGRIAAKLIASAFLAQVNASDRALLDAGAVALARAASFTVGEPLPRSRPVIRMADGALREPVEAAGVADALRIAVRPFGDRMALSVSVEGLWSCTTSDHGAGAWFGRAVGVLGLNAGTDYVGCLDADGVSGAYVDAVQARLVLDGSHTQPGVRGALAAAVDAVVREAVSRLAVLPGGLVWAAGKTGSEETPGVPGPEELSEVDADEVGEAGETSAADEPWAEAFDFGRLVPVVEHEVGGAIQQVVSARDVHMALRSGRKFTTWFEDYVRRCSLVQGVDISEWMLPKFGKQGPGGHNRTDFLFTLTAAKKVAMAVSGRRGNAVRSYFIECERRLLAGEGPLPGSSTPSVPSPVGRSYFECRRALASLMYYSLATYLNWAGVPVRSITSAVYAFEGDLVMSVNHLSDPPKVMRDPLTNGWVFQRAVLDAWWEPHAEDILSRCKSDYPAFGPFVRVPR